MVEAAPEKLAAETSKALPNEQWNAVHLPTIQAMIALHRDEPARSVELLASASPYERAYPDAIYVRGLAYLRMHKGAAAAAEFQKIVDQKGSQLGSDLDPPELGTALPAVLSGNGTRLRACRGHSECEKSIPGLLRTMERCRPRYSRPQTSQSRVCEVEVTAALETSTAMVLLAILPVQLVCLWLIGNLDTSQKRASRRSERCMHSGIYRIHLASS